jgi:hypothetical protein
MAIEPKEIVDLVEGFVSDAYSDASKFENSSLLDESGVWTLHQLAADIYAAGFEEGVRTEEARNRGKRERKFMEVAP